MSLKIISFCLYGSDDMYCIGSIENIKLAKIYYPDWICRIYVDNTVPSGILDKLKEGADIVYEEEYKSLVNIKKCRRFLPLLDEKVYIWISRNVHSRLTKRESIAVNDWVNSNKSCHIIRDSYNHTATILPGLFGINNTLFKQRYKNIPNIYNCTNDLYVMDKILLNDNLWPIIRDDHIYHDYWSYTHPQNLEKINNQSVLEFFSKPRQEYYSHLYLNNGEKRMFTEDILDEINSCLFIGQVFVDNKPDNNQEYILRNILYNDNKNVSKVEKYKGKIVYKCCDCGLGDILFGFISCFYLSKLLNYQLFLYPSKNITELFDYPILQDSDKYFEIHCPDTDLNFYIKLKTNRLDNIFPSNQCSMIKSGQNFSLTFFDNPYHSVEMNRLCENKTDLVKIFFKNVNLTDKAKDICKNINFNGYLGIHYRCSKNYSGDSFVLEKPTDFVHLSNTIDLPLFIACDDYDSIRDFDKKVTTLFKTTPRHIVEDQNAILEAFSDIWALSTCDQLIISYWSNYSRIAALINKQPTWLVKLNLVFDNSKSQYWLQHVQNLGYNLFSAFNVSPFERPRQTDWYELLTKHKKMLD